MKHLLGALACIAAMTGPALAETEEEFKQAVAEGARSRGLCTIVIEVRALGRTGLYEVVCRNGYTAADVRYVYNSAEGTFSGAATQR